MFESFNVIIPEMLLSPRSSGISEVWQDILLNVFYSCLWFNQRCIIFLNSVILEIITV